MQLQLYPLVLWVGALMAILVQPHLLEMLLLAA
jgi:hypothetical protein